MRAWIFQDSRQLKKLGEKKCPWSVAWYEDGRKRSRTIGSKSLAQKYRLKKMGELANGIVDPRSRRTRWADLRKRFIEHVASRNRASGTLVEYNHTLDLYEQLMRPQWSDELTTAAVDEFVKRRQRSKSLSPSTINKDLRTLRTLSAKAVRWRVLVEQPEFEFLKEFRRDPEFIDDQAFDRLYQACDQMKRPGDCHYSPAAWWRALLTFGYMSGWRIGQILSLERRNLDFDNGMVRVVAEDTKGKRDERLALHPVVLAHLKGIEGFSTFVFEWPHHRRTLSVDFDRLKEAAGVDMPGQFHRLRYGFATANAGTFEPQVLQRIMQHADAQTTARYVNIAERVRQAGIADRVHVPANLRGFVS